MLKTKFNITQNNWVSSTTDILPKHDLYFGTPVNSPTAGIPIGDGDMGSLVWLEKDGIHINIGKTDLWQDAPPGTTYDDACYITGWEECQTCQKHGGEITIRFDSPVFDYMYQDTFSARLSLADASVYIDSKTPFGSISAHAFGSAGKRVSVIHCSISSAEGEAPEIRLARWGSRTLWRWYNKQRHDPSIGLEGTETLIENDRIFITQELNATKFCLGLALVTDNKIENLKRRNSHEGAYLLECSHEHDFTLYYTIRLADTVDEAKKLCSAVLDDAISEGSDAMYKSHRDEWADFWNRSRISLADDYIENLYYLYLYYMNSESRGAYPPHFTSGVWGYYHDFLPWTYYYNYNMQHLYAPLDAAGHGELAQNYYDMKRSGLDMAYRYADMVKGKHGAFFHEVTDRYSRGADYDICNASGAALLTIQMYKHYRYTGNEEFLREYVIPMMRGAVEYYLNILERGRDGKYHTQGTACYEGELILTDTITDKTMIIRLFSVFREYAEPELKDKLNYILERLHDFETMPLSIGDDWDGEYFTYGVGKGRKPVGEGRVFSIGYDRNGKRYRRTYGNSRPTDEAFGDATFPDCDFAPLYPAGILGLADRGTEKFDCMQNQVYVHSQAGGNWNMITIFLARMGMADEFIESTRRMISLHQHFPNGFNVEGDGEFPSVGKYLNIENSLTGNKFRLRQDDFIHFDFETVPVLAQGVTDALLQSHEGIIRLCPAVRPDDNTEFTLFAEGGFKVSAEITGSSYVVSIENMRGEPLYVRLPEYSDSGSLYIYKRTEDDGYVSLPIRMKKIGADDVLDLSDSAKGDVILLLSVPIEMLETAEKETASPNSDMKTCGAASLGSPHLMD